MYLEKYGHSPTRCPPGHKVRCGRKATCGTAHRSLWVPAACRGDAPEEDEGFPPAGSSSCSRKDRNSLSPQNAFLVLIMSVPRGNARPFHRLLVGLVCGSGSHGAVEPIPSHHCGVFHVLYAGAGQRSPSFVLPVDLLQRGENGHPCRCWPQAGVAAEGPAGEPGSGQGVRVPAGLPGERTLRLVACPKRLPAGLFHRSSSLLHQVHLLYLPGPSPSPLSLRNINNCCEKFCCK